MKKKIIKSIIFLSLLSGFSFNLFPLNNAYAAGQCFTKAGAPIPQLTIGSKAICESRGNIWREEGEEAPPTNVQILGGAAPQQAEVGAGDDRPEGCGFDPLCHAAKIVGSLLLGLMSQITQLAGRGLNWTMNYTIVDMAKNFNNINGFEETWKSIRDIANMGFIFILLYTSVKMILGMGGDVYRLIKNIIVAAILINFSLFITKVVIDFANVIAITFYSAIVPGGGDVVKTGMANVYVDLLKLTTIWNNTGSLSNGSITTIAIMGSIILLVAAFSFLAIAIMLIIRFVVLIFVMVLSPIAFVADIFPAMGKAGSQWREALFGQAFFAPIYLFLSWVTIKVLQGIVPPGGNWTETFGKTGGNVYPSGAIELFVHFLIVIGFMITSLIVAKGWANKAGSQVSKLTGFAFGTAGGVIGGGTGWVGRTTLGFAGKTAADNATLQKKAQDGNAAARLALYASKKARSATFDPRRATVPTSVVGDFVQGTVGRTGVGRKLGLDDVRIPSIPVGESVSAAVGAGKGTDGGFTERRTESKDRVAKREAEAKNEAALVEARNKVKEGANSTDPIKIAEMEKALAKLTDKQTEALVAGNRELINSLNFANKISVQQLEAINKSDKLSEGEKAKLIENRYSGVKSKLAVHNTAVTSARAANTTPPPMGRDLSDAISGLHEKELEIIDPEFLRDPEFVGALKASQIDSILKSGKFTKPQKDAVRTARKQPLLSALHAVPPDLNAASAAARKLGHKEIAGLDMVATLLHPTMLQVYTVQMLKRMAPEMNSSDIPTLRAALLIGGSPAVQGWLNTDPDNFS